MAELRYFRKRAGEDGRSEITYYEALRSLLTTYRDNDMTRDMLLTANRIPYRFGEITVHEIYNGRELALMPGLSNMAPMDAEYDDNGNRI